jgi:putative protein-disulfide isomerase
MKQIHNRYQGMLTIEVLSGGMIMPRQPVPVRAISGYVMESYQHIEEMTGVRFGSDYLWHMQHPDLSDWFPSSEKSAIALRIFKEYEPELQIPFAADLQYALFYEGRDLTDDEAYRHLIRKYQIDEDEFYEKLHSTYYREKAVDEFALCERLQVTGFPQLMLQVGNETIYLIHRGYADFEALSNKIDLLIHAN